MEGVPTCGGRSSCPLWRSWYWQRPRGRLDLRPLVVPGLLEEASDAEPFLWTIRRSASARGRWPVVGSARGDPCLDADGSNDRPLSGLAEAPRGDPGSTPRSVSPLGTLWGVGVLLA